MEHQILAIHVLLMILYCLYGFITKKSVWDYVYIFAAYLIVLQWTFQKGECILSLMYKKAAIPNYKVGDYGNSELYLAFPEYPNQIRIFLYIQHLLQVISIYLVFTRNHISVKLYASFLIIAALYKCREYIFTDCYRQVECILFEKIVRYIMIIHGIYILWILIDYRIPKANR